MEELDFLIAVACDIPLIFALGLIVYGVLLLYCRSKDE